MKLNLFLSVVSFLVVLHLCKAGPLRLQKRAVFYIANETACVVDNIVYSNGDPIPTDDPCEACKCRPPGFACVLKQCKVKAGCKAIRRIGQCCPDYVCGCEHNGRMYKDGEEIRDPKNPCYKCECQGSSIACAFVDCFFRDDCETFYHPGECCPEYKNCTRDTHEVNQFPGSNALPPVNLLPELNYESVLPGGFPSTDQRLTTEKPTNPTQSPTPSVIHDETPAPEVEEPSKESDEAQTDPVSEENENTKRDAEVEASSEEVSSEVYDKKENEKESVEEDQESKTLFNSEIEISKTDSEHSEKVDPTQSTVERIKMEEPQTTVSNKLAEPEIEKVTEKPLESEPITTQVPESGKQVKNSAADNGKSLKIPDEELDDLQKHEESTTDAPKEKLDETATEPQQIPHEVSSETEPPISKKVTTENKSEYEETQANPQVHSFYSNNEKVKSESAETVTIVVHVREKAKPSTEEIKPEEPQTTVSSKLVEAESEDKPEKSLENDLVTEKVNPEPEISTVQGLLKSNDELKYRTEVTEESSKDEDIATTDRTYEVFTTLLNKDESTTKSQSTEQPEDKVEKRSDENEDPIFDETEHSTTDKKVLDEKKDEDSLLAATTHSTVDETSQTDLKVTESDEVEMKTHEPMVTVIKIDPSTPVKIKIISDSVGTIVKIKEDTEEGSENQEMEETKSDQNTETTDEVKIENVEEINPEVREDDPTLEETTIKKDVEETSTKKYEETTSTYTTEKPEEPLSTEKVKEAKLVDSTPETHKQVEETTTVGTTEVEKHKHDEISEPEEHKHDETSEPEEHKHDEIIEAEEHKYDENSKPKERKHDEMAEAEKHKLDENSEPEKHKHDETAEAEEHKHDETAEAEEHKHHGTEKHKHDKTTEAEKHKHDENTELKNEGSEK